MIWSRWISWLDSSLCFYLGLIIEGQKNLTWSIASSNHGCDCTRKAMYYHYWFLSFDSVIIWIRYCVGQQYFSGIDPIPLPDPRLNPKKLGRQVSSVGWSMPPSSNASACSHVANPQALLYIYIYLSPFLDPAGSGSGCAPLQHGSLSVSRFNGLVITAVKLHRVPLNYRQVASPVTCFLSYIQFQCGPQPLRRDLKALFGSLGVVRARATPMKRSDFCLRILSIFLIRFTVSRTPFSRSRYLLGRS